MEVVDFLQVGVSTNFGAKLSFLLWFSGLGSLCSFLQLSLLAFSQLSWDPLPSSITVGLFIFPAFVGLHLCHLQAHLPAHALVGPCMGFDLAEIITAFTS